VAFSQLKRREFSTLARRPAEWPSSAPQGEPLSHSHASELDRRIHVLILIPTLNVGGAEIDLVRIVPKIDRARFRVTVCTFLERGELGKLMQGHGIEVIGPFSPLYLFRLRLRGMARRLLALLRSPLKATSSGWRQRIRRIVREICRVAEARLSPLWVALGAKLTTLGMRQPLLSLATWVRIVPKICVSTIRALHSSLRAIVYLLEIARIARPISRYIRSSGVDVIHTVLPNSYLVGGCAAVLAGGRPLLMSRLSLNLYQQENRLVGFIERRILHRAVDAAIGNSNAVLRDLRSEGVSGSKLQLVYNGIDVRGFEKEMVDKWTARRLLGISNGTIVFTVVANLHPYKGHKDLLRALATVCPMWRSDWLCLVVGKDVHGRQSELERLSLQYGLSSTVEFLGPRADVPIILSASDIHISASHEEGLPNNIIEAMCARLPVVATAVGGVPELVVHGHTGYLLPPQDVDRMADALVALARAPIQRQIFGEAGYARAMSHFNVDDKVAAFESIYNQLSGTCHHRTDRSWSADLPLPKM
jgi:glycosyltransferase involved in cell wall biosynthesis